MNELKAKKMQLKNKSNVVLKNEQNRQSNNKSKERKTVKE